ncbi:MAG: hypothetical protein QM779_09550 [Propionicimonas sp.]|uniref:hypothetical protein n=1 Tax=Propionicimonas sp. TaxID=1955623 RepID=UPI003D09D1EB
MADEADGKLVDEVVVRSLWAFPDVARAGEPFSHRVVADGVLVGWAAPGGQLGEDVSLGAVDARRAAALAPARARAFRTGRALVGTLLRELVPGSSAWSVDTAPCVRCGGDHGPVAVRGVPALASVAYADGLVVAAVASAGRASRLGVDAEADRSDPVRASDLARLLSVPPDATLRRWTQVEAVLKAAGLGLRVDPAQVRFRPGSARIEGTSAEYRLAEVTGPAGFVISLAWKPVARVR